MIYVAPLLGFPAYPGGLLYAAVLVAVRRSRHRRRMAIVASPLSVSTLVLFPFVGTHGLLAATALPLAVLFGVLAPFPPKACRSVLRPARRSRGAAPRRTARA